MDTSIQTRRGAVRWAVNFEQWRPDQQEWEYALSIIQPEEKERVGRFKRPVGGGEYLTGRSNPDAKSALIGRLLMRKLIEQELGIKWRDISLGRTKENKPYLRNPIPDNTFPNFNFNVSHHGQFVALASEPHDIVGVDVMTVDIPRAKTDEEKRQWLVDMTNCFTPFEWRNIRYTPDLTAQSLQFFRHWTLKEAYIKAVGIGLGFELQRAEFTLDDNVNATKATLRIDGKEVPQWRFDLQSLDAAHLVATARGPPAEAIESYRSTLGKQSETSVDNNDTIIPFTIKTFKDLLPAA